MNRHFFTVSILLLLLLPLLPSPNGKINHSPFKLGSLRDRLNFGERMRKTGGMKTFIHSKSA
jgi:hypothetical protein